MKYIDNLSLRSKIAVGTISQVVSRLAIAILSIFTLRYSTQYLGAEAYGQYATVIAYVTIFTLLTDLGLTAICSREIAKTPENTEKIIGNGLAMRILLSVLISPLITLGGWWLYTVKPEEVRFGIALMVVTLIFGSAQSVVSALFTAKNRNDIPALLGVINKAAYLLCIVAVGGLGLGFYGFVYAAIIASVVSAGIATYWASKRIRLRPMFHLAHWQFMIRTSIPLGIIQIINLLYYKLDSLMLSIMRSPLEVGLYTIAYGIIDVVMSIPSMFMTSLMPTLATATKEQLRILVQRAFGILAFFAFPIAVGGALLSQEVILLISNQEFVAAALPFAILIIGAAFSFLNAVFGFASVAVNKQSRMLKVSIITIILNILINLFFIPRYGVVGAASATLITEIVACVGVYLVFWQQTGISVRLNGIWKLSISSAAMVPAKLAIDTLNLPLLLHCIVAGGLMCTVYIGLNVVLRGLPADFQPTIRHLTQWRK